MAGAGQVQPKEYHGHPMFYQLLNEEQNLHDLKNRTYASKEEPLGNFERGGRLISKFLKDGINPTLAYCLVLMAKQIDGVYDMVGESKESQGFQLAESLHDKLRDISVYSKIAMIILAESKDKPKLGRDF